VRSAAALAGDRAVVVSPITLAPRRNFYAAADDDGNSEPAGMLPPSVDVRQPSLYGAAWTAGSLKYLAESGAAAATYYESTGWRGVLERAGGTPLPDRFFSQPGRVFPLYHPLADACEWTDAEVLDCSSTEPLAVVGLAVRGASGALRLLVANVTTWQLEVDVQGVDSDVFRLRRLDETTVDLATSDPVAFRSGGDEIAAERGTIRLSLAPYAVVRLDGR
jgi:hypothetical protein